MKLVDTMNNPRPIHEQNNYQKGRKSPPKPDRNSTRSSPTLQIKGPIRGEN